jgi:hypothetical protein
MWRGEMPAIVSRAPNQSQGYYLGSPLNAGSGSGMGGQVAGMGSLAAGQNVTIAGQDWHPTVLYLAALVVAEMFVFGLIGRMLSK